MKKINGFIALIAAALLCSCAGNTPKEVTLNTQLDSLNYAFGLANGADIQQFYLANDSTGESLKQLLAGIHEGMKGGKDENTELTGLGTQIGSSLKQQAKEGLMGDTTLTVNIELINQGLVNGLMGSDIQMTSMEAQEYLQTTMQTLQAKHNEEAYKENREAGEKFLAENAAKTGIIITESGLQYEIIKAGKGKIPTATDKVKVHYHGTLVDGTVFDSSVERGEPVVFGVNQVIPGWTEALQLMPVGSKWKLYIPYSIAYGEREAGEKIKPYSALIFEVELLGIEK